MGLNPIGLVSLSKGEIWTQRETQVECHVKMSLYSHKPRNSKECQKTRSFRERTRTDLPSQLSKGSGPGDILDFGLLASRTVRQ